MDSHGDLVIRARSGDLQAFGELVHRFRDMACGYAYSVLGDSQMAQDAAQEAFIEAHERLGDLREPAAFPGWLRRIVFKHCDRYTRGRKSQGVSLDSLGEIASDAPRPDMLAEQRDTDRRVLDALSQLPEKERTATTLYYMNGYSQSEVADFLEVPVNTVKTRLRSARERLRERMVDMVADTLKQIAPDERFSKNVMDGLIERPNLLNIPGHPVRVVWELIRKTLPGWELVSGPERLKRALYDSLKKVFDKLYDEAYQPDSETVLRPHMTHVTFDALKGRAAPVRLLTAGRVFRPEAEDHNTTKVFHQADGLCVEPGADCAQMKARCERLIREIVGDIPLQWKTDDFPFVDNSLSLSVQAANGNWHNILGCGTLKPSMLTEAGFDPAVTPGYGFGFGLERLAMAKYEIDDVWSLWREPYTDAHMNSA